MYLSKCPRGESAEAVAKVNKYESKIAMKFTKPFFSIILSLLAFASSCQKNDPKTKELPITNESKKMDVEKFYWQENINSPLGYPVEVYKGGLEAEDGSFVSLSIGPDMGNWGELRSGMSTGVKAVPNRLNLTWISYAENVFYNIDTIIDYEKMTKLFKEGYQDENRKFGRKREEYNVIMTGFAPGGMVVVWIAGASKQVEIGRYQASPMKISLEEIDRLDSHDKLLFDEANIKRIMAKESYVPLEVQKANKGKPIPFGLWEKYRNKFSWKVDFQPGLNRKTNNFSYTLFNGERDVRFSEQLPEKNTEKRAIPLNFGFGWSDESGQRYGGYVKFDESEIFNGFSEIAGNSPEAPITVEIKVNVANTFVTATLISEGKKVHLKGSEVNAYKSRRD